MEKNRIYHRGEIYYADLNPVVGSEQGGKRPVLILQNNFFAPTLIVAPLTSKIGGRKNQPTHYFLEECGGIKTPSIILLEQIKTIDKKRIASYTGRVSRKQMREIDDAIHISLGLYVTEGVEAP